MKLNLKIIKKGNQEIEIVFENTYYSEIINKFKNFTKRNDIEKKIKKDEIDINLLYSDFSEYIDMIMKDKIKIMIKQIRNLSFDDIIKYEGEYYLDEAKNLRKTILFDRRNLFWQNILKCIWKEINSFDSIGDFGEEYQLKSFYFHSIYIDFINRWEAEHE